MSNSIDAVLGGVMGGESYYDPSLDKPNVMIPEGEYYAHVKEFTMKEDVVIRGKYICLLYTSPSPRDGLLSRMPSSA